MQLWIAQGDQPLPRRRVITYKDAEGQPQFRAQFSEWNLSPDAPDSPFAFTPSEGATKIAFALRKPVQAEKRSGKGKRERGHDAHDMGAPDGMECSVRGLGVCRCRS